MFNLFILTFFTVGVTLMFLVSDEQHRRRMRNRYLAVLRATARSRLYASTDLRNGLRTPLTGYKGNLGEVFKGDAYINEHLDQAIEGEMAYAHDGGAWDRAQRRDWMETVRGYQDVHYEDTMMDDDPHIIIDEEAEAYEEWIAAQYEEEDGKHTTATGWDWA